MVYNRLECAGMKRVGVRELKQNASRVVKQVAQGGSVVVTVNGRDAVMMTPLDDQHRWVPSSEAMKLWESIGGDPEWAKELEQQRDEDQLGDPWT